MHQFKFLIAQTIHFITSVLVVCLLGYPRHPFSNQDGLMRNHVLLYHKNVTVTTPGVGTISLPCVSDAVWISMGCEELQQLSPQTGKG